MQSRYRSFQIFSLLFLLIAVGSTVVLGDEVSSMWSRIYSRARGYEDKIMIMTGIIEVDNPSIVYFLGTALADLNEQQNNISSTTELLQHQELTKMVVRKLGELKAGEFSDLLYDVIKTTNDPYLKGEAIIALGRTANPEYSDDIAIFLRNLNLNIETGREDKEAEVLALAAVLALERFSQPVGYTPLFFASIGWYSKLSSVREQASRVLDTLVADPTETLKDLVRLETQFDIKIEALMAEYRSNAPPEGKTAVAVEALQQGLVNQAGNATERSLLSRMRQNAMGIIREHGPGDDDSLDILEKLLYGRFDVTEKLTALETIGTYTGDNAALVLVKYLKLQNDRQMSGLAPEDYRVIKTTIRTLGILANPIAFEELSVVKISNWPPAVVRDADEAIKRIQ